MNDDARWVVDTIKMTDKYKSDFDMAFRKFTLMNWSNVPFYRDDRENMRDFITELVHEIEALQSSAIRQESANDTLVQWAAQYLADAVMWKARADILHAENKKLQEDANAMTHLAAQYLGSNVMYRAKCEMQQKTIDNLADRLAELGPANPHEDDDGLD